MEANNLLQSEVKGIGSRIEWLRKDVDDVSNVLKLLRRSEQNNDDQSILMVLDIMKEKLECIVVNDIPELDKIASKIEKLAESVEDKPKQRRSTNKRPRKQAESKTVDLVDTIIEKEKQAAGE